MLGLDFCVDTGSIRFTSAMVGLDAAELSSVRTWFVPPCVLGCLLGYSGVKRTGFHMKKAQRDYQDTD